MNCISMILLCISDFGFVHLTAAVKLVPLLPYGRKCFKVKPQMHLFSQMLSANKTFRQPLTACQNLGSAMNRKPYTWPLMYSTHISNLIKSAKQLTNSNILHYISYQSWLEFNEAREGLCKIKVKELKNKRLKFRDFMWHIILSLNISE